MKRGVSIALLAGILLNPFHSLAQTDPGTENLLHQWTFDDGTPKDGVSVNAVDGQLMGGASIADNALKLSANGQYLSFSGSALALNAYPVITQEIWFTSVSGANTGYTMLSYFGGTDGTRGYNYVSTSAARGDDISRTAISDGTWDSEISADGPEYDDGMVHHMVSIISQDSVILYIDGEKISATPSTIPLSTISTSLAYLGKGGYTDDKTWIGSISMFSIYNRSLTPGEVKYLFQKGPEQSPLIVSSSEILSFDEFYLSEHLLISGFNLSDSIAISVPDGISASSSKLAPDAKETAVLVTYDGSTTIDGNLTLISGDYEKTIPVKSYTNDCFTKLYPGIPNLIENPYISSLSYFSGWGDRRINTNPDYVYCGATSGWITGSNSGSLDVPMTGKLLTSTQYRVKAKVFAIGGTFQVGVFGWSEGQADINYRVSNTGSWQDVDFTFTTGTSLGSSQGLFFNNYDLSGTTGYIDNWECYAIPKIYSTSASLEFITPSSKSVKIRGVNLFDDILITAPEGFTVSPTTMPGDVNGESLTITFNGSEDGSGYVNLTSGEVRDSIYVNGSLEPSLVTSVGLIKLDEIDDSTSFVVTGYNLSAGVSLSAPAGITLSEYTLPSTVSDKVISVLYDGTGNSSGEITLQSGTCSTSISLQAIRNDACFTPLYTDRENLIKDPTCNFFISDGWGGRRINTDPAYVYCGARSGEITDYGSLDRVLTGVMKPNTTYRVRAKVYKKSPVHGNNMGNVTYTLAMDSAANPEAYRLITTAMDSACYYFNKYSPFIEDIYVYYSSGIPTAQASYRTSIGFGPNTWYMWVGTAIHEMAHYFGSGTTSVWQEKMATGTWSGTVASDLMKSINGGPIYGDSQHFWPYGINYKEEITDLGSQAEQAKALSDAVRIIKAMLVDDCGLPTNNPPVGVGVYGWDAGSDDIYYEVTKANTWQDIDFTFTTGSTLKESQGVYFNNGTGFIDNWEMYDISSPTAIPVDKLQDLSVYVANDQLSVRFDLAKESDVRISVYDIQGKLVLDKRFRGHAGLNSERMDASQLNGLHLVRVSINNEFFATRKIIH